LPSTFGEWVKLTKDYPKGVRALFYSWVTAGPPPRYDASFPDAIDYRGTRNE